VRDSAVTRVAECASRGPTDPDIVEDGTAILGVDHAPRIGTPSSDWLRDSRGLVAQPPPGPGTVAGGGGGVVVATVGSVTVTVLVLVLALLLEVGGVGEGVSVIVAGGGTAEVTVEVEIDVETDVLAALAGLITPQAIRVSAAAES